MKCPKYISARAKDWLSKKGIVRPTLSDFYEMADICSTDTLKIIHTMTNYDQLQKNAGDFHDEFNILEKELNSRYSTRRLDYDRLMGLERESSLLIYILIRALTPKVVLETGVANGVSSFFILNAVKKNGHGALYSFDTNKEVGGLLNEDEKSRWSLSVLDKQNIETSFRRNLGKVPYIDFFIHDSDHSYKPQMFEYRTVYPRININGILASDDVDASYAFLDFCWSIGLRPKILVENRKVFGLIRKMDLSNF